MSRFAWGRRAAFGPRPGPSRSRLLSTRACVVCALGSVGAVAALTTCSYPNFKFDRGEGGEGGDGSGAGAVVSQVPCGTNPQKQCNPGEVCCYHKTDPNQDHCGAAKTCGTDYDEFYCNTKDDCSFGICCAKDNDGDTVVDEISCQTTCMALGESPMCTDGSQCPSMTCISINYPGYSLCQK